MGKPPTWKTSSAVVLIFAVCIQLLGVVSGVAQAETVIEAAGFPRVAAAAREAVAEQMSTGLPSSATVAVVVDGEIVYAEGFGLRDRALSLPVELDTQFNIGSVSKVFTAACILILAQQGKLELDKPVVEYLPEFVMQDERYKEITVRMLLNHTSGLPGSYWREGITAVKNRDYVQQMLEALAATRVVNDPGTISICCNDGFTVAQAVIERVSGMSFADFLDQEIFTKMALTNTSTYFKEGNENVARVYDGDSTVPRPLEYVNIMASGGLASTAIDLCKFGEILQPDSILNPEMLAEYTKAQPGPETVPTGTPWFTAGLGWDFVSAPHLRWMGVDVLAKNGGTWQYNSQLYVVPREHISVAVIFAGMGQPAAVANAVLEAVLRELGILDESVAPQQVPPDAPLPDDLERCVGFYNNRENGLYKITLSEDKSSLVLSAYDGSGFAPVAHLAHKGHARFDFPQTGRVVIFAPNCQVACDSLLVAGREAEVEKGSYLLFVGEPGDVLTVHAGGAIASATPVWEAWDATGEYADYADILALFADRVKYSTIAVPLDYDDPSVGTLDVAVLKAEAKNPAERWGSILFNPGGPGGDGLVTGLLFAYLWSEANPKAASGTGKLFQELAEHYDLVGFSPRGLGSSTNLVCSSDTYLVPALILSADSSEENLAANMQNARAIAEACLANPMARYINTEATARDMDVIRQVLGDEKLNFIGISYGTLLGIWYASLFPDKVGNMLLIGQTDVTAPLNEALLLQEMGMQRVLEKKLVPYASSHSQLFHLGATESEVMSAISTIEGTLKHVTIKALDAHISFPKDARLALFTLRSALVIDSFLAQNPSADIDLVIQLLDDFDWDVPPEYQELLSGIAHELARKHFDLVNSQPETVNLVGSDAVWWVVQGMDASTPYDADSWALQSTLHSETYPQFGGFYATNPILFWNESLFERPPIERIPSDASILIVQSEYDPYTPLESAVKTFSALPQASMIVVKEDYQHLIILPYGNDDLDRSVAEFFLQQRKPPRLSVVDGNPLPLVP